MHMCLINKYRCETQRKRERERKRATNNIFYPVSSLVCLYWIVCVYHEKIDHVGARTVVDICAFQFLQDPSAFENVMNGLRAKVDGKAAACMKRLSASGSGLKRPAAAAKGNAMKSGKAVMKSSKAHERAKDSKPPDALKRYPHGCSKCRWQPGCTPSCFRYRGEWP